MMIELDNIIETVVREDAEVVFAESEVIHDGFASGDEFGLTWWSPPSDKQTHILRNLKLLPDDSGAYFQKDHVLPKMMLMLKRQSSLRNVSRLLRVLPKDNDDIITVYDATGGKVVSMWWLEFMLCEFDVIKIDDLMIHNNVLCKTLVGAYEMMVQEDIYFELGDVVREFMRWNLGAYIAVKSLVLESDATMCYHLSCRFSCGKVPGINIWKICYNTYAGTIYMDKFFQRERECYFTWSDCYIAKVRDGFKQEFCAVLVDRYDDEKRDICVMFNSGNNSSRIGNFIDSLLAAGVKITQEDLVEILK